MVGIDLSIKYTKIIDLREGGILCIVLYIEYFVFFPACYMDLFPCKLFWAYCSGQGTAGAALVSQLNLDYGLHNYFSGSAEELYYGQVRCEYVAYQDDIGKPSIGVNEAQAANIKLSHMFKEKGLEAHPDKTCFVVFGSPEYNT